VSVKENKAIWKAFIEQVWNGKNLATMDELFTPDYVEQNLANPDELGNLESAKQTVNYFLSAFPDVRVTNDDMFAEGDRVAIRMTARGTHKGEFMGIAPTGKKVTFMGISDARIADGKIAECWEMYDTPGLMRQIGADGS
jgi:steroid delta-isomerase-like uncharacterized protein